MTITARGLIQLGYKVDTDFVLQDDSDGKGPYIKEWLSKDTKPTDSAIDAATKTYDDNYAAKKYQRDRASEYPSWEVQLDKIYHSGLDAWKADIKAIKDKYPKPS